VTTTETYPWATAAALAEQFEGVLLGYLCTQILYAAATLGLADLLTGGLEALAAAKRLVRDVPAMPSDDAFRAIAALSARLFASEEALEGMTAFTEQRPPRWASQR
jgi:enoyl-CoA hydratase/carnithine racemase